MKAHIITHLFVVIGSLSLAAAAEGPPGTLKGRAIPLEISNDYPHLEQLYHHFHAHPELSLHEEKTSQRLADELEQAGFKVTRGVGGYGVVAVLSHGSGPTVLVRTDMDALPVTEQTGLPY